MALIDQDYNPNNTISNQSLTNSTYTIQQLSCKCLIHQQEYPQNGYCVYCGEQPIQVTYVPFVQTIPIPNYPFPGTYITWCSSDGTSGKTEL